MAAAWDCFVCGHGGWRSGDTEWSLVVHSRGEYAMTAALSLILANYWGLEPLILVVDTGPYQRHGIIFTVMALLP